MQYFSTLIASLPTACSLILFPLPVRAQRNTAAAEFNWLQGILINLVNKSMLGGTLVTTAWSVLRLLMEGSCEIE
jgi:hypothetical protein